MFKKWPILELTGKYGTYFYANMGDGVVLYSYKLKPEYSTAPAAAPNVIEFPVFVPIEGLPFPIPVIP